MSSFSSLAGLQGSIGPVTLPRRRSCVVVIFAVVVVVFGVVISSCKSSIIRYCGWILIAGVPFLPVPVVTYDLVGTGEDLLEDVRGTGIADSVHEHC